MHKFQVICVSAIALAVAGCTSSAPPAEPASGYSLMAAVEASGEVAYKLMERGFPTMQACEQRMHALESSHDIVLRCIASNTAL